VLVLALLGLLIATGARRASIYALVGVVLWLFVRASGIHATIAGVLLALMVPARKRIGEDAADAAEPPLQRMEHALRGVVAFAIMPLFALANAGVPLGESAGEAAGSRVAWGIVLGLVLGKPLGILLASYAAVRAGAADLPANVGWRHVHGAGWLGGIGFTMSLFIASLAFGEGALLDIAKVGVIAASAIAGLTGYLLLRHEPAGAPATNVEVVTAAVAGGSPRGHRG
jgi:NhaA family Na+:H+ antiporter